MTTIAEARESIYEAFVTGWGALSSFTFDNEAYTPPVGAPWVRLTMRHVVGQQASLGGVGNRKFDRSGVVFVQIFVPLDQGAGPADPLVEKVIEIFEGTTIDLVRFIGVTPREIGPLEGYYQVNVDCPFEWTQKR